jgi:hypothetical protein
MATNPRLAARRRGMPSTSLALIGVVCAIAALFIALPTVTLLAVGMTPSVVAYLVDLSPGRYACRCVAALNFAGTFPYVINLWNTGHTMAGTFKIAADPFAWLVMFSAAGVGWLMFIGVPGMAATIQSFNAKRSVESLKERQRVLVEEWGKGVTGNRANETGDAAA